MSKGVLPLLEKIISCDFTCEGGPLHHCTHWNELCERALVLEQSNADLGAGIRFGDQLVAAAARIAELTKDLEAARAARNRIAMEEQR